MAAPSVPHVHEVGGFRVAPIKFNSKSGAGHLLYFKEHTVRENDETKPTDRTLFVVNVPPYCNQQCLERLFGDSGPVESVILQTKPGKNQDEALERIYPTNKTKGFKVAYVIFKHSSSITVAMQRKYKDPFILSPDVKDGIETGYRKWCSEYLSMWPDPKQLQKEVDAFMADFDKKSQDEEDESAEAEGVPDEEGWVTVTRKTSSKPVVARSERKQKRLQAREKKKREEKELMNFYTFQNRESKRQHIAELRQKFEEDKQKIAQMRAARKFKPY